jgi:hypothetical protein
VIRRDPLLRTDIAEYRTLLLVVSSHLCFLQAIAVDRQPQSRFPPLLFPQPVQAYRKLKNGSGFSRWGSMVQL